MFMVGNCQELIFDNHGIDSASYNDLLTGWKTIQNYEMWPEFKEKFFEIFVFKFNVRLWFSFSFFSL